MCDCFLCFSGDPLDDDPRAGNTKLWKIPMKDAPLANPAWCCYGCWCQPCALYSIRMKAMDNDMSNYTCCQGYLNPCQPCGCGFPYSQEPGDLLGERGSVACLCIELFCCYCCALNGTRFYLQDKLSVRNDPCDNKIIRFNNCLQIVNCIVFIIAKTTQIPEIEHASLILDVISEIVWAIVSGCMIAQMEYEMNDAKVASGAPIQQIMQKE